MTKCTSIDRQYVQSDIDRKQKDKTNLHQQHLHFTFFISRTHIFSGTCGLALDPKALKPVNIVSGGDHFRRGNNFLGRRFYLERFWRGYCLPRNFSQEAIVSCQRLLETTSWLNLGGSFFMGASNPGAVFLGALAPGPSGIG